MTPLWNWRSPHPPASPTNELLFLSPYLPTMQLLRSSQEIIHILLALLLFQDQYQRLCYHSLLYLRPRRYLLLQRSRHLPQPCLIRVLRRQYCMILLLQLVICLAHQSLRQSLFMFQGIPHLHMRIIHHECRLEFGYRQRHPIQLHLPHLWHQSLRPSNLVRVQAPLMSQRLRSAPCHRLRSRSPRKIV